MGMFGSRGGLRREIPVKEGYSSSVGAEPTNGGRRGDDVGIQHSGLFSTNGSETVQVPTRPPVDVDTIGPPTFVDLRNPEE